MKKKDENAIKHIRKYCFQLEETFERFGKDFDIFCKDNIYQNAALMCILQIGEIVTHLSDEFKEEYKEVPWRGIKGMRNIVAHRYESVELLAVWETMVTDIPELLTFCTEVLEEKSSN